MTTRRSFMSFLAASVVAVSTSVPMLNRRQVDPVRPPTPQILKSVCGKCWPYECESHGHSRFWVYAKNFTALPIGWDSPAPLLRPA